MIKGSCCCGAVKFGLLTPPQVMGSCHCTRCRKLGTSTAVFVKRADVVILEGRDEIAHYQPEPPYIYGRDFCRRCGSSLGEILSELESFPISADLFDDPLGLEIQHHLFVSEKPEWLRICDAAPQFDKMPPEA